MLYKFPSPLEAYRDLPPLSDELDEDGKSFKNPKREKLSDSYERFTSGIDNGRRGGALWLFVMGLYRTNHCIRLRRPHLLPFWQ
jgi:hypothetical protein